MPRVSLVDAGAARKKGVVFADHVRPGDGTSSSDGEGDAAAAAAAAAPVAAAAAAAAPPSSSAAASGESAAAKKVRLPFLPATFLSVIFFVP